MWLTEFRETFLERVLDLIWRQWTSLGVSGHKEATGLWPIDPEALLAFTLRFGRFDPRLLDACIEWWSVNGDWLSSTRLQKVRRYLAREDRLVLGAITEAVVWQKNPAKWQRLVDKEYRELSPHNPIPLFLMRDGKPLPQVGSADPVFLRFGFLRPRWEPRGAARAIALDRPPNLRIRLRGIFGVTSRAEIVLYLLTHESAYPHLVARQTLYTYAAVSKALAQMAGSGLFSERRHGRERVYQADSASWRRFLKFDRIEWLNWSLLFRGLEEIWKCIERMQSRKVTPAILGSELRRGAEMATRHFRASELAFAFSDVEESGLDAYPERFAQDFERLGRLFELTPKTLERA